MANDATISAQRGGCMSQVSIVIALRMLLTALRESLVESAQLYIHPLGPLSMRNRDHCEQHRWPSVLMRHLARVLWFCLLRHGVQKAANDRVDLARDYKCLLIAKFLAVFCSDRNDGLSCCGAIVYGWRWPVEAWRSLSKRRWNCRGRPAPPRVPGDSAEAILCLLWRELGKSD